MTIRVPGDKSLTQRALILASLADGESSLSGLLHGGDAASTAGALRMLGVPLGPLPRGGGPLRVEGVGLEGFSQPDVPLDLGNSGTGTRLLMGVLAGTRVTARLDGDASLRSRPMARVTDPLSLMGATFRHVEHAGRLPIEVTGARPLKALEWDSPVASAQVKSALLLAGVTGGAFVLLTEPRQSRDHTERLLAQMGCPVVAHAPGAGWRVELRDPPERLAPLDFRIPGDPSSAAFFAALAALGGAGSELVVEGVGLNPTRTAFLATLRAMGAHVDEVVEGDPGPGEPVGTLVVRPGALEGVEVSGDDVTGLIDELPLLAVVGARAHGETRITGASELRHKESDRITATVENLRTVGVEVEELEDGMVVVGSDHPLTGRVRTHGDHRIAMAFGILGALPGNRISVDDRSAADVSFPGFWDLLRSVVKGREA